MTNMLTEKARNIDKEGRMTSVVKRGDRLPLHRQSGFEETKNLLVRTKMDRAIRNYAKAGREIKD